MQVEGVARESASSVRTLGWRPFLLVFVVVVVAHALSPSVQVGDSRLSVPVATQLVRERNFYLEDVPAVAVLTNRYDVRSVDGHDLPFYPWPAMLFAVPGSVAFDAIGDPGSLKPTGRNETWKIEIPTASVLVAATTLILMVIVFDTTPGSVRRRRWFACFVALVFAFGTGAWSTASRALWQHTPSMLFLTIVLLAAIRIQRSTATGWSWGFGAALVAAYAVRPSNAVALVTLFGWLVLSHRQSLTRALAGGAAVAIGFFAVNVVVFRELLPPYYAGQRLGSEGVISFWETAAMYAVSPSRGMVFYNPLIIIAAAGVALAYRRKTFTRLDMALIIVVLGQLVVVARYGATGGSAYGPRLMTDVLPFVTYLSLPALLAVFGLVRRPRTTPSTIAVGTAAVVLAWGFAVNASGALLRSAYCWSATPVHVDSDPDRTWSWSDPQFARPIRRVIEGDSLHDVVLGSCDSAEPTG